MVQSEIDMHTCIKAGRHKSESWLYLAQVAGSLSQLKGFMQTRGGPSQASRLIRGEWVDLRMAGPHA